MMQILHITFEAPRAGGSGAQLRSHALNAALARQGQVTTISVAEFFAGGRGHPRRRAAHVVAEIPAPVLEVIAARAAALAPDLVVLEGVYLADVAARLIAARHRLVLDAHNVECLLLRQIDLARRGVWARLSHARRWARAARAEQALFGQVGAIWACSSVDAARIARLAPAAPRAKVIPNPVPAWCASAPPPADRPGIAALFVGHLGYRPNINAVRRLAERVWPRIIAAAPEARLTIAGRAPAQRLRRGLAARSGLELIADPPDLALLYQQATMVLVPLAEGGGTRIKVLEALACATPVVASATAVEGLGLQPGRHYLAAESDAEFAAAALRLGKDAALRAALRDAGRAFVARHHAPDAIDRALAAALGRPSAAQAAR